MCIVHTYYIGERALNSADFDTVAGQANAIIIAKYNDELYRISMYGYRLGANFAARTGTYGNELIPHETYNRVVCK